MSQFRSGLWVAGCLMVGACQQYKAPEASQAKGEAKEAKSATAEATDKAEQASPKQADAVAKPEKPAKEAPPMYAGSHVLISYKGAKRAKPTVTRSKEDAEKRAKEVLAKAKRDPKKFAALAKEYSDGPTATRGGDLGAWRKGQMVPAFDQAVEGIKIGDVTGPVETPFGYHVIIRNTLPPIFAGSHILVAYKGATRVKPEITRSKADAKKRAEEVAAKAKKTPDKFAELAKEYSDGPSARMGGSLGKWPKGRMVPQFDHAIAKLKIGEVSGIVETPFGFHVMKREDPEKVR